MVARCRSCPIMLAHRPPVEGRQTLAKRPSRVRGCLCIGEWRKGHARPSVTIREMNRPPSFLDGQSMSFAPHRNHAAHAKAAYIGRQGNLAAGSISRIVTDGRAWPSRVRGCLCIGEWRKGHARPSVTIREMNRPPSFLDGQSMSFALRCVIAVRRVPPLVTV